MGTMTQLKDQSNQGPSIEDYIKTGLILRRIISFQSDLEPLLYRGYTGSVRDKILRKNKNALENTLDLSCLLESRFIVENKGQSFTGKTEPTYICDPSIPIEALYRRSCDREIQIAGGYLYAIKGHLPDADVIRHLCCLDPKIECPYLSECFPDENTDPEKLVAEVMRFRRKR